MVTENINIVITTRGARVARRQIAGIGRSSRTATVAVRALGVALTALAGGATVGALFRLSDAATEVGNRIRTVTSSTEVFLSVQDRLFDVASRTGGAIEGTARLYQRLAVGTRDIGVGSARVINVVEGLNAALVVSGSTAREAEAALLQLGQGLASDNLSGEELRSLRENLPQLAQALSDELGVGIGALKELGRQGKLNAETVFPALERAIGRFQEQLANGDVVFTFAQAFNAVRNEVLKAFTIFQKATGVTKDLNKAIFDFSEGLAENIVRAVASAIDFTATLIDRWNAFGAVLGGFGPILAAIGQALSFLGKSGVVAVQALNFAFNAWLTTLAGANVLLQKALRLLGLASDFDVDTAVATAEGAAAQNIEDIVGLVETLGDFGEKSFLELATGIDLADGKASGLSNTFRDVAESLRAAADAVVPLADDADAAGPGFFERAAERTAATRTERGTEDIDVPEALGEGIATSFREGFAEAIKGGGDLFELFSGKLEDAANNALVSGFERAFDTAEGLLQEAFQSASDFLGEILPDSISGIGPILGDVLSGALQFVALQALSALFGGGGNRERNSTGNVQSAVTSTQAVRGIVAGPTEIAIANVGRNIAEAIDPLLQETEIQTGLLRGILAGVVNVGAASGGDTSDTAALAFGSAPTAAT